jgi:hypothetical protein
VQAWFGLVLGTILFVAGFFVSNGGVVVAVGGGAALISAALLVGHAKRW